MTKFLDKIYNLPENIQLFLIENRIGILFIILLEILLLLLGLAFGVIKVKFDKDIIPYSSIAGVTEQLLVNSNMINVANNFTSKGSGQIVGASPAGDKTSVELFKPTTNSQKINTNNLIISKINELRSLDQQGRNKKTPDLIEVNLHAKERACEVEKNAKTRGLSHKGLGDFAIRNKLGWVGENLAQYVSEEDLTDEWFASYKHAEIMLSEQWRKVDFATCGNVSVTLFTK